MKSYIFTGIVAVIAFVGVTLPADVFAVDMAIPAPEGQSSSSADVNTTADPAPAAPSGSSATSADVSNTSGSSIPAPTGTLVSSTDAPTPPAAPVDNSGSSGSTGSGGSSFSGGSSSASSTVVVTPASCPLITDYLKLGGTNDAVQVTKLQSFLKNVEKLDVDVNGSFDAKTESAVIAFQKKYAASILGPWDASEASGFVFITTLKTINQIACASRFALTAEEQAIIDEYKARRDQNTQIGQNGQDNGSETGSLEIGTNQDESENVAAVGRVSILSKLWEFIKELFR